MMCDYSMPPGCSGMYDGGDGPSLTEQLKSARGKRYFDILKAILNGETGAAILRAFDDIKGAKGAFQLGDLARLAQRYDLNFKATCEWLEENRRLPTGTYDLLKHRGLKVRKLYAEVEEWDSPPGASSAEGES